MALERRFGRKNNVPKPSRQTVAGSGTVTADSDEPSGRAMTWVPIRRAPVFKPSSTCVKVPGLILKMMVSCSPGFIPFCGAGGPPLKPNSSVVTNDGSRVLPAGRLPGVAGWLKEVPEPPVMS